MKTLEEYQWWETMISKLQKLLHFYQIEETGLQANELAFCLKEIDNLLLEQGAHMEHMPAIH